MTGQIAGPSVFSLELVGLIAGVSMIVGAVDLLRQPGWAWRRAEENKAAYFILVVLLPLIGLTMYLFRARPEVAKIAAAGRAASLPFERFGENATPKQRDDGLPPGTIAAPAGLGSFGGVTGATTVADGRIQLVEPAPVQPSPAPAPVEQFDEPAPVEVSSTFFSSGGTATRTLRPPAGLTRTRTYRPKQRTSLAAATAAAPTLSAMPAVPAGWKADPTGRHQFRYWDGFQWTENVADAGAQSRDAVSA
jgi:Protein of unknown function (DUF2510)